MGLVGLAGPSSETRRERSFPDLKLKGGFEAALYCFPNTPDVDQAQLARANDWDPIRGLSGPAVMVPRKQAGHMTCTRPQAERQILLAMRASSTHDPAYFLREAFWIAPGSRSRTATRLVGCQRASVGAGAIAPKRRLSCIKRITARSALTSSP